MAIDWNDTYTNTEPSSADYPHGGIKNATAPDTFDGTPLEKAGFSDLIGWIQAAMQAAGEVPSGNPETARASQVLDSIINHRWYAFTNYAAGTRVVGSDGLSYRALQASGPKTTTTDPVTEGAPRTYWLPEEQYFNDKAHPVGSIYMSSDSTDPADVLGVGTWSRIQGRFIAGVSDTDTDFNNGTTGGSKTHNHGGATANHALTVAELPAHSHDTQQAFVSPEKFSAGVLDGVDSLVAGSTSLQGGGEAHNHGISSASNLPPYTAKYIWERTA